ncbi:DUF6443 domain-containing protein, partial [Chryseobacterium polytrichastri]
MKKIIIPIGALLVTSLVHAQNLPNTENYVQTRTYLEPVATSSSTAKQIYTVQYFDGLGRPKQVVNVKASPQGRDVVTLIEYDSFGRQTKDFLPIPQLQTLNGAIVPTPLANVSSVYGGEKIYAEKILENSPLDRIQQQIQVGTDWSNKPVKFDYDANIDGEVKKYVATFNYTTFESSISLSGSYGAAQLYKTTVTDEDGNKTIEFKNGQGQTLLIRKVISTTENADTYYVYNDYNQLAYVIPPLASISNTIDDTLLNNLCYRYIYDGRNRLVEKRLPGKGWEYFVYDKTDRLILSQDANLKGQNKWQITKYDQFGRVAYTGFLAGGERAARQQEINSAVIAESRNATGFTRNGMTVYYTDNYFIGEIPTILTVNYYDTYPQGSPTIPSSILGQDVLPQDVTNSPVSTKSLPLASYVKNIEDDNWTKNYSYYDTRGRVVGSYSINHLGGRTKADVKLDFAGAVQQTVTLHKRLDTDTDRIITENFTYDHQNRLLTHTHQVDSNPVEILAQNTYNELSQLESKKVGGIIAASPLQQIDYQYNIRGWMTKINNPANLGNDLFAYKINYNTVEGLETPNMDFSDLKVKAKYNGNISEVSWKTLTEENEPLKRYGYVYDPLNRLSAGFYQREGAETAKEYFEKLDYNLNGNILRLQRSENLLPGSSIALKIDNLKYDYTGNRLTKVTEEQIGNSNGYPYLATPNTITYDDNGNMTSHR